LDRGEAGLNLGRFSTQVCRASQVGQAHCSLAAPPTPDPLLEMETVASSKLQEDAAATIEAPESNKEETRPEILMVGSWKE
jgi:hypothetical protein